MKIIPRHRLAFFGLMVTSIACGFIASAEVEAGDFRFRPLRYVGLALLVVAAWVYFRGEWKKKT